MEVVFDTSTLPAGKRRQAWRDAICEIYLQVDCQTDLDIEYIGLVREAKLGDVTITDAMLSPQIISRGNRHIGRFGKDCYYLGIEHIGAVDIRQSGASFVLRPGRGSLYYANEPYELHSNAKSRQFWIELPRAAFDRRFDSGRPPLLKNFDLTRGLGRIAAEFCATVAAESGGLDEALRSKLGEQSASEWLQLRRLQRCHDLLTAPQHSHQSITEIAYSMGFSSSSHFSNLFRAHFDMRPSDVRGAAAAVRAPSS
jgi:AraC-like DNA-binding protein